MEQKPLEDFSVRLGGIREDIESVEKEFGKSIIGNTEILRSIIIALLSNGHVLLEGLQASAKP